MRRVTVVVALSWLAACSTQREGPGGEGGIGSASDSSSGAVTTASTLGSPTSSSSASGGDASTSLDDDAQTSTVTAGETVEPTTGGPSDATEATGNSTGATGATGDSLTTSGGGTPEPINCGGKIWACGDGIDNDADGLVDLHDPECTGPCDDDEASFATGLPGDNKDCKQDCFFDGNSGSGDDGCEWNLKCDPLDPGAGSSCAYTGGNNCSSGAQPTQACVDFCGQFVPAGCDCFGCCRVDTGSGFTDVFLGSGTSCSLDNLDGCNTCTYQADVCGNTCDPENCELCFGQDPSDLPPECDGNNVCDNGLSCDESADCGDGFYCQTGCCHPVPVAG